MFQAFKFSFTGELLLIYLFLQLNLFNSSKPVKINSCISD